MEKVTGLQTQPPRPAPHRAISLALILGLLGVICPAWTQPLLLPSVSPQDDRWSCAPNSATRVLGFYGHRVTYPQLKALTAQRLLHTATGTPPSVLVQVLQKWEGKNVRLKHRANFSELLAILKDKKPVIALVQVGEHGNNIPALHWLTVTGFDPDHQIIFYTDTDDRAYQVTYGQFQQQWQMRPSATPIWAVLRLNGIHPNTIVWIDR